MRLVLVMMVVLAPCGVRGQRCAVVWRQLQPGVDYATAAAECGGPPARRIKVRDRLIHLVRVDPRQARLRPLMASNPLKNLTARRWSRKHKLTVVANLGMYTSDHTTHVGYLRHGGRVISPRQVRNYQSVLVLDPTTAAMRDGRVGRVGGLDGHHTVVQNLRLIRAGPDNVGVGVWSSRQTRRWSEAALAQDRRGRLLFVFVRMPLTMWELNRLLLALPLGIVRGMHLEGGPEASLSIYGGGVDLDLCGSFETDFMGDDSNDKQWPLPNILAVERP